MAVAPARDDLTLRLTPMQSRIFRDDTRFRVVVAGRRSGKTHLACTELLRTAANGPGRLCWYVGPTFQDTKDVAWKWLRARVPGDLVAASNAGELTMELVNGSEIQMMSAERSKRGRGLDFVVLDEFAEYRREVWDAEIRPALSDTLGKALFISTPAGHNWAYDFYMRGVEGKGGWSSYQFTTLQGGLVPETEVRAARDELDPRIFRQEYEASFETLAGRVYSNFDREGSIDPTLEDVGGPLLVGMDFNVNPMSAVVAVRAGDECHVLDALEVPTSNTEEMARELRMLADGEHRTKDYLGDHPRREVVVCPDPSGRARRTSAPAGETDFTILKRAGFKVRAPKAPPKVVDRINNVQAMLLAAAGRRRLRIHPRARKLIRALDGLTYKEGTSQPDKTLGLDHVTDALGYLLWREFNTLVDRTLKVQPFKVV